MELTNKEFKIAEAITQKLRDSGFVAYLAGGCVRDFLMNRPPTDYDIATTAQPEHVEQLFDKTVPVGKQFGVMLVLVEGITFEVATFRSEGAYLDGRHPTKVSFTTPEEDAERRDFTVNGLFFDPATR
ncbi:MAG: CCA tRNA nucleotidyltransferase, partial [Candidatus Omnitrophica bacterium]|nr:CCA tRNA nucleotidyltransferase [Candidatus Omnitrophota bacterium]